jgi:hypothetical protein
MDSSQGFDVDRLDPFQTGDEEKGNAHPGSGRDDNTRLLAGKHSPCQEEVPDQVLEVPVGRAVGGIDHLVLEDITCVFAEKRDPEMFVSPPRLLQAVQFIKMTPR